MEWGLKYLTFQLRQDVLDFFSYKREIINKIWMEG